MRPSVLLVALAAVLAGCASAPPAPPAASDDGPLEAWPAWAVGDAWTWSVRQRDSERQVTTTNVTGTVVEVHADTYVVESPGANGTVERQTFWRSNLTLVGARGEALRFPLATNATWPSGPWQVRVDGLKYVDTPAGTFRAWHLEYVAENGKVAREEWWSPEAKIWVRSKRTVDVQGATLSVERVLAEYRPAP